VTRSCERLSERVRTLFGQRWLVRRLIPRPTVVANTRSHVRPTENPLTSRRYRRVAGALELEAPYPATVSLDNRLNQGEPIMSKRLIMQSVSSKKTGRTLRRARLLVIAVPFAGWTVTSCGDPMDDQRDLVNGQTLDEPTATSETTQALYNNASTYWCTLPTQGAKGCVDNGLSHGARAWVPVCWEPTTYENPDFFWPRAIAEDVIRRNWVRYARINLVHPTGETLWGPCSPGQDGIHLYMDATVCGGANTGTGTQHNRVDNGIRIPECWVNPACKVADASDLYGCVGRTTLHEMGHGLGFFHENERADAPISGAGTSCRQAGPTGGQSYGAYNCNIDYWPLGSFCSPMWSGNGGAKHPLVTTWDCIDPQACDGSPNCSTDITPGDIAAIQRVYGRRQPGTLVSTNGRCAASPFNPAGADAYMWDCDEGPANTSFSYHVTTRVLNVPTTQLFLGTANSTPGTAVELVSSATATGSKWDFKNVYIRGWGGLCLDLANGNPNGGLVSLWVCGAFGGNHQKWTITGSREIRFGNTSGCLTAPPSGSGQLFVSACTGIDRQKFGFGSGTLTSQQSITSVAFAGKCLDSQGWFDSDYTNGFGLPRNGQAINLDNCKNVQFNQKFNFTGNLVNGWGLCLDRGAGHNGSALRQQTCSSSENQVFDYYFRTN
jgi:hypothetical protein